MIRWGLSGWVEWGLSGWMGFEWWGLMESNSQNSLFRVISYFRIVWVE